MKNSYSFLVLFAVGLTSCATRGALPSGVYIETRGPGVVLFESKELRLYPDHQFDYIHWTDMEGEGPQGKGTYSLRGPQLHLHFDGRSVAGMPAVQVHPVTAPPAADSVAVTVDLRFEKEAAGGLTVLVFDETGRVLTGASSNPAGRAHLALARTQRPQRFTINGIGFQQIEQPWPLSSTAYTVQLAEKLGPAYKAGKILSFQVLQRSVAKLVLRQGADTITLVASLRP